VEGLEEDVEEIRARRAALSQAVGSMPNRTIDLAITKSSTKKSIERLEAAHQRRGNTSLAKYSKDSPPRQRIEALLDIEARQP
jgi:hypothetical protein